jgi:serine phosphatase RsbU (regulator of sigma subunit)
MTRDAIPPRPTRPATVARFVLVAVVLGLALLVALLDVPVLSFLAKLFLAGAVALGLVWLAARAYQAVLWKVGRRLAFSYFLIGVLPIPMVALLAVGTAYVLSTFLLSHLYRDCLDSFQHELVERSEQALDAFAAEGTPPLERDGGFTFDYYRQGARVGGAGVGPQAWPAWLTAPPADGRRFDAEQLARFVAAGASPLTVAVGVEAGDLAVVGAYGDDLAADLRRRSGLWMELLPAEALADEPGVLTFKGREVRFQTSAGQRDRRDQAGERAAFFAGEAKGSGRWDQPLLYAPQVLGPLTDLATGEVVSHEIVAQVFGTPRMLARRVFAGNSEYDTVLWIGLAGVASGLATVYAVAVVVALYMIVGLSRAVNRLSRATESVQRGDFSVRIPVRRRDQVGALQTSFNEMAAHLEDLVAMAAQKEVLERELAIARELQESLLPRDLPHDEAFEFATLFEPSAALGGDYFDILRLDEARLAVVIADVSGHGLSSGLRMAMLKAALSILVEQGEEPPAILRRLDALVRGSSEERFFVTATLTLLDLESGRMEIWNAGHPPTYVVRRGGVREVVLPGSPLGSLGQTYGHATVDLLPGDLLVWLSDGFIEATDADGEPFGYARVVETLAGSGPTAREVRARLLAAVEAHAAGRPAIDDRTLVVMAYRAAAAEAAIAGPGAPAAAIPSVR